MQANPMVKGTVWLQKLLALADLARQVPGAQAESTLYASCFPDDHQYLISDFTQPGPRAPSAAWTAGVTVIGLSPNAQL